MSESWFTTIFCANLQWSTLNFFLAFFFYDLFFRMLFRKKIGKYFPMEKIDFFDFFSRWKKKFPWKIHGNGKEMEKRWKKDGKWAVSEACVAFVSRRSPLLSKSLVYIDFLGFVVIKKHEVNQISLKKRRYSQDNLK